MGGNILTLPSDYIEEGRKEGREEGRLIEIFSSVQEGDYSIVRGAQKAKMSIDQFEKSPFPVLIYARSSSVKT